VWRSAIKSSISPPLQTQIFSRGMPQTGIRAASLPALNSLMQLGPKTWRALRQALFDALAQGFRL